VGWNNSKWADPYTNRQWKSHWRMLSRRNHSTSCGTLHTVTAKSHNSSAIQRKPHVARRVRDCFVQKNVDALLCPAVSLELSAIKYVWDVMEQRLRRLPNQPLTFANLG
jgi:hypothetical protein